MSAHTNNSSNYPAYIGRFAPSPTGPLHYGSLLAAVASYLQAKKNSGQWLIRIEDIDPPREVLGATDNILRTLELYQFEWDQRPLYQSTRPDAYHEKLNKLKEKSLLYACSCSRKQIGEFAKDSVLGKRYPGTCSNKTLDVDPLNYNLRLRTSNQTIHFIDAVYGQQTATIFKDIGDFVIYRKNDLPTYALAASVDDAYQGITEVVRGHDLLAFTPLQIYLCKILQLPIPKFLHIPIVIDENGCKLSKQSNADALSKNNCTSMLLKALNDLGQKTPKILDDENLEQIWNWAIQHWDITKIPRSKTLTLNDI